ncbi:MAG: hypothetical protein ACK4MV_02170 [Beijerinckiaceae bacterium]
MIAASPRPTTRTARTFFRSAAAAAILVLGATGAMAQSCNDDIGGMQQKRNVQLEALNKITKANKGKLDPVAACPRLRTLAALEREMLAYMEKNQSWCSIPDQIIEQVKTGSARTSQIAGQACKIAEQARAMQQQQQSAAPAPALPRGPL